MALWKETDTANGHPNYLSEEEADKVFFVDKTEMTFTANRSKGIKTPGWNLYETYVDSDGNTRHRAEALVAMKVAANTAGDVGAIVLDADQIEDGGTYTIVTAGNTDFTAIGAANNTPGTTFTANAVGSGSGTVRPDEIIASSYVPSAEFPSITGWFDISDVTSLYQNTLTTAVANGDSVGTINNKADLGENYLSFSGAKGTYDENGPNGNGKIIYGASNTRYRGTAFTNYMKRAEGSMAMAFFVPSIGGSDYWEFMKDTSSYFYGAIDAFTANNVSFYYWDGASKSVEIGSIGDFSNNVMVVATRWDSDRLYVSVNGGTEVSVAVDGPLTGSGTLELIGTNLTADREFYEFVSANKDVGKAELKRLSDYLVEKWT